MCCACDAHLSTQLRLASASARAHATRARAHTHTQHTHTTRARARIVDFQGREVWGGRKWLAQNGQRRSACAHGGGRELGFGISRVTSRERMPKLELGQLADKGLILVFRCCWQPLFPTTTFTTEEAAARVRWVIARVPPGMMRIEGCDVRRPEKRRASRGARADYQLVAEIHTPSTAGSATGDKKPMLKLSA